MVSQTLNAERDSGEIFGYVNIMRATTEVGEWFFQGNSNRIGHVSIMYVDSPSTTSATTYKTQIRASTTSDGGKVRANQQSTSGESPSSIHLIEIAG
jgi:hypothetical protein